MNARRFLALIGVGLVLAAAAAFLLLRPSGAQSAALDSRQRAMELLGAHLAKIQPDAKVLVLSNPFAKESGFLNEKALFEKAGLRGLRRGLGAKASVEVVFPEILPEYFANPQSVMIPSDSRTPLSFLIRPASVDALAEAHPGHRFIVSLIGLPAGVDQLKLWDSKDPHAFALLLPDLRLLGPPARTLEAFQQGKLLAAVAEDESGAPFLVTRENIEAVLERQPKALGF